MKGYIKVDQWHSRGVTTLDDIVDVSKHKGDAVAVDQLLGFKRPDLLTEQPPCYVGEVVFRVEDDATLTQVMANYDSSG